MRGIFPLVSTVTAEGYERVAEDEVAERFGALVERQNTERREEGDRS